MSETLRRYIQSVVCIAAALCCGDRVWAQISLDDLTGQGSDAAESEPVLSPEEQIARLEQMVGSIRSELTQTRSVLEAERASDRPLSIDLLERSVDQLRQLLFLHEQLISEYQRLQEVRQLLEAAIDERRAARAGLLDQLPPYDFETLDELLSDRLAIRSLQRRSEADLARARTDLQRAEDRLEELEAQRRAMAERTFVSEDPTERTTFARRRELALINERAAEATVNLQSVQRDRAEQQVQFAQVRLDTINLAIEQIEPRVSFTEEDLANELAEIDDRQDRLTAVLERVFSARADLQNRLAGWMADTPEPGAALEQRIAIAQETLAVLGGRSEVIGERRRRLGMLRDGWNDRFRLVQGEFSAAEVAALVQAVETTLESLDADEAALIDRSRQARARLIAVQEDLNTIPQGSSSLALDRLDAYRGLGQDIDGALEGVELTRQLFLKLQGELEGRATISLWDRVVIAWSYITRIWTYEIIELSDDAALTVGKLILGLALLALAFNLSRWLAVLLSAKILPRFGLHAHAASAFKSIVFYVLLLTFALMALRIINVPLTVFAVLGGAVAIGIGFGSQTIASNFMSGLILLAERPVRVGDFIDVNGVVGTVQHIGARSTRIKTPTNIEMILPNASLLENNLINWTLTDQLVWLSVDVGVAYGSPTREAAKLLLRAAEEHGRVLKNPGPRVNFDSFGDNSLNFKIFFAINLNQPADRLVIPSDLRFRIDNLFRDAGITIAFPQRDVHLDTLTPLQVELTRAKRSDGPPSDAEPRGIA
jgi:small-conductance mechanosensitive channel